MANPEHVDILSRGVEAWNTWREKHDTEVGNLCGATLQGGDWAGADFRHTILVEGDLQGVFLDHSSFQGAQLDRANLQDAQLNHANLQHASLVQTNLQGAGLEGANLSQADLHGTMLRETRLQGATLTNVKGLQARQLAGSDVSGALLPDDIATFEGLGYTEELSKSAKKLFLALLLGCIYTWLTIGTTSDVRLLTNSASSPLPLIGTEIPIVGFYVVAPLILLGLYVWFHLYLQRLWKSLSELPAYFPDGKALYEKAYPWLVIGLVHRHVKLLQHRRPPLAVMESFASILLIWWLVPLTLLWVWGRFLTRHDWPITAGHILLLGLTAWVGIAFYELATATLQGRQHVDFSWKSSWERVCRAHHHGVQIAMGIIFVLSLGAIYSPSSWSPRVFSWIGFMPFADLFEEDISLKPPNWTGLASNREAEMSLVKGAKLPGANLRHANMGRAFLIKADLKHADLQKANLFVANLQGASMNKANLKHANLFAANLQEANLEGANLQGLNLNTANLQHANLEGANLQEANLGTGNLEMAQLSGANLQKANLGRANLQHAYLGGANLQNTDLGGANLQNAYLFIANLQEAHLYGANLQEAHLYGANLYRANLYDANLQKANLADANLQEANLRGATLHETNLRGANLTSVINLTPSQLNQTCVDERTTLPDGFTRPKPCPEKE